MGESKPFTLKITIIGAINLPAVNRFGNSSDPYVRIYIGSLTQRTATIRNNLNPKWNEVFQFPLLALRDLEMKLDIFDHNDALADELIGSASLMRLEEFGFDEEHHINLPIVLNGGSPRGNIQYTFSIQSMIQVQTFENLTIFNNPLVNQVFDQTSTSITVRQGFSSDDISNFGWSQFSDLLNDVNHLFSGSNNVSRTSYDRNSRDEYRLKFAQCLQIDLIENTYSSCPPVPRFSITIKGTSVYTIIPRNKFMMWKLIRDIRRRFTSLYPRAEKYQGGNGSSIIHEFYSSLYWPEIETQNFERSIYKIDFFRDDGPISCECVFEASDRLNIILPDGIVTIDLKSIRYLLVGCEFSAPQPYDLRLDLISGQIDTLAFLDAQDRAKALGESYKNLSTHSKSILGGAAAAASMFKDVFQGAKKLIPGRGQLIEDSVLYMDLPGGGWIQTEKLAGTSLYWGSMPTLLKISEEILHPTPGTSTEPMDIMLHLVAGSKKDPFVLGSKIVRLVDLIPSRDNIQDKSLNQKNIKKSQVKDLTIELDRDLALRVDVIKAIGLSPSSDLKITCYFSKLDGSFKKKYKQYTY